MAKVAITSHLVSITWQKVSLTDQDVYYYQFDAFVTPPATIEQFRKDIEADPSNTNVRRIYVTNYP